MAGTTFVIGAGASVPFKFPTSEGLRWEIVSSVPSPNPGFPFEDDSLHKEIIQEQYTNFAKEFAATPEPSIDAFLELRSEHADRGRFCIAAKLLPREYALIAQGNASSDWIAWVIKHVIRSPDRLISSVAQFIVFNYDNVLEIGLYNWLRYSFNLSHGDAWRKVKEAPIVHVYGQLEYELERLLQNNGFAARISSDLIVRMAQQAANGIHVIPDARRALAGR